MSIAKEGQIRTIDDELIRIQRSTRTFWPALIPVHDWFRMHWRWYYQWHLLRFARAVHIGTLVAALVGSFGWVRYELYRPESVYAVNSPVLVDLVAAQNWNVRIDGATVGDSLGLVGIALADLDNNGRADLIATAPSTNYNDRTDSGSVYIIYDSNLSKSGTGNIIDLADSTSYNLRIDSAGAGDLGEADLGSRLAVKDLDGDGKLDLLIVYVFTDNNGRANSGSTYVFYNSLLDDYTGTGNNLDLAASTSYNLRFDGPSEEGRLFSVTTGDINQNNKPDILIGVPNHDANSRDNSGSIYLIDDDLIDNYSGTGNTIDLATSTNYNLRFDGALANEQLGIRSTTVSDVNSDGINDLLLGALGDYNGGNSGSFYYVNSSLLPSYSGTGTTVDLATSTTFTTRYDGEAAIDNLAFYDLFVEDFDGDGKQDFAVGAGLTDYNGRTNSGSSYFISGALIDDYIGTGNTSNLVTASNFSLRFDGAAADDRTFDGVGLIVSDYFGLGRPDIIGAGRFIDNNARTDSGSAYVISNSQIRSKMTGTGNTVDLATTTNYAIRYDAAAAGDRMAVARAIPSDIDGDKSNDLLLASYLADNNSRSASGSIYLIYNFPHSIGSLQTIGEDSSATRTVTGTVNAGNSTTTIEKVQYNHGANSPTAAGWTDCQPAAGDFDGQTEDFTCKLTLSTYGTSTFYIRAMDSAGKYTSAASYAAVSITYSPAVAVAASPSASPSLSPSPSPLPSIDQTPPSLSLSKIGQTSLKRYPSRFQYFSRFLRPSFSGTTEADAKITVAAVSQTGSQIVCQATGLANSDWQCQSALALPEGEYKIKLTAEDSSGNLTALPEFTLVLLATSLEDLAADESGDEMAPAAPSPSPESINSGIYETTVSLNADNQPIIGEFRALVTDKNGRPLPGIEVTLYSIPQTVTTDRLGIAVFKQITVGDHRLNYSSPKHGTIEIPLQITVKSQVLSDVRSGQVVTVRLRPAIIRLPLAQIALAIILWPIVISLIILVAGYLVYRSYRRAERSSLASLDTRAEFVETELTRIQSSTRSSWPILAYAHNWARMHSPAYYWWHTLPYQTLWHWLILTLYLIFIAALLLKYL